MTIVIIIYSAGILSLLALVWAGLRKSLDEQILSWLRAAKVTGVHANHRALAAALLPNVPIVRSAPRIMRSLRRLHSLGLIDLDYAEAGGHELVIPRLAPCGED